MTQSDIIDAFRERVKDVAAPYLWSDPEVIEYLNDAENEAAERASLLRDSTTAEICEVNVIANEASYDLDDRVLQVLRARLNVVNDTRPVLPLTLTVTEAMDIDQPGWESESAGDPRCLVIEPSGIAWRATLVPPPSADAVLLLHVYRLPLEPVGEAGPEIHPRLHIKLLDWMCYRAYSKQDAETLDAEKAAMAAGAFAASFGKKLDIKTTRAQHDHQFPVVRPSGL